MKDYSPISLNQ